MQIAVPFRRAEGIVELLVKCVKFFVNRVRLGIGLEDARFQAGHRLLRGGVILVRARHNGGRNGRTKRARLRRARNFHRPASNVRVNLHHQRIFLRNAAAIDDLPDLHAVFLEAVDDGQRAKCRGFDERAVNFRRRGVKRLAEQQSGKPLVHQNRAVAVVPVEREQAGFARLQFRRARGQFLVRAGFFRRVEYNSRTS